MELQPGSIAVPEERLRPPPLQHPESASAKLAAYNEAHPKPPEARTEPLRFKVPNVPPLILELEDGTEEEVPIRIIPWEEADEVAERMRRYGSGKVDHRDAASLLAVFVSDENASRIMQMMEPEVVTALVAMLAKDRANRGVVARHELQKEVGG